MNSIAEEIWSYFGSASMSEEEFLEHYGMPRRSGRYPWGSGDNPYQRTGDFLSRVEELKKIGWEETPENIALRDSFGNLTEYADYNTAFMDLEAGALDAVAMDIGVAAYQIESRGGGYVMLDQYLATEQYGVGFLLGNEELRDTVEKTLQDMAADGTFAEIAEKWGLTDSVCLGK